VSCRKKPPSPGGDGVIRPPGRWKVVKYWLYQNIMSIGDMHAYLLMLFCRAYYDLITTMELENYQCCY